MIFLVECKQEFSSQVVCSSYQWLLLEWHSRHIHLRLLSTLLRSSQFRSRIHRSSNHNHHSSSNSSNNNSSSSTNNSSSSSSSSSSSKDQQLLMVPLHTMLVTCRNRLVVIFNQHRTSMSSTNNSSHSSNQCPFNWLLILHSSLRVRHRISHQLRPSSRTNPRRLPLLLCSSSMLFLFSSTCR